jgi:hypothetical protein
VCCFLVAFSVVPDDRNRFSLQRIATGCTPANLLRAGGADFASQDWRRLVLAEAFAMSERLPPGWSSNPSAWSHRLPVLVLLLLGTGIGIYLGLFQIGLIAHVWEPFFGPGSSWILKESGIAQALPIPDALVGAGIYLFELVLEVSGGSDRWRRWAWVVLLLGLTATGLALGGLVLTLCQALVYRTFCTLCLTVAACSLLIFLLSVPEVWACWQQVRRECSGTVRFWQALFASPKT